jgi:hypothetical protein
MTRFALIVGFILTFFCAQVLAQPAGRYDVTVGGTTYELDCNVDINGNNVVFVNGQQVSGTWSYVPDSNNVKVTSGEGVAILEGARGAEPGDEGKVLDGNTGPPHQQAGTWERPE